MRRSLTIKNGIEGDKLAYFSTSYLREVPMPRHDGSTNRKRISKHRKTFKPGIEDDLEPPKEVLMARAQDFDRKKRPSAGSSAVHRKIFREEADHDRLVITGLRKACIGAGLLKDDPATIQRISELRQRAAHNLLLRQQAGLEKF